MRACLHTDPCMEMACACAHTQAQALATMDMHTAWHARKLTQPPRSTQWHRCTCARTTKHASASTVHVHTLAHYISAGTAAHKVTHASKACTHVIPLRNSKNKNAKLPFTPHAHAHKQAKYTCLLTHVLRTLTQAPAACTHADTQSREQTCKQMP
jgi:hypothetical protein